MKTQKQAIVLIHGIGEQVPMDTLRGFVEAVWTTNPAIHRKGGPAGPWSKPDDMSGDYELRRLTTAGNTQGVRTDFFEFYWAHLLQGTRLSHVWAWARILLLRSPARIPKPLLGIWLLLVGASLILLFLALNVRFEFLPKDHWLSLVFGAVAVVLWPVLAWFLIHYAGDAARYLHVAPPNIQGRHAIRAAGIRLLEQLHVSGKYHRIVLVGHSLGSVIGYDILTHLWSRHHDRHATSGKPQLHEALDALEKLAREQPSAVDYTDRYQIAQAVYFAELRAQGSPWLVTDFVTLGSPLAHATVLLARKEDEFLRKQADREFPTCPPAIEHDPTGGRFSFEREGLRVPHHAATFAPTRWTNLFFPSSWVIKGDVIGGPLAPVFGSGVRDVTVSTRIWAGLLSHTLYWKMPGGSNGEKDPPDHIKALREALNLSHLSPVL